MISDRDYQLMMKPNDDRASRDGSEVAKKEMYRDQSCREVGLLFNVIQKL